MNLLRSRLFALVFGVMAVHLAALVTVSVAQCALLATAASSEDGTVCTCPHGANAECPMHKHSGAAPTPAGSRWCAGCPDGQDVALLSLLGLTGTLVGHQSPSIPHETSALDAAFLEHPVDLVFPPVSPPPRG